MDFIFNTKYYSIINSMLIQNKDLILILNLKLLRYSNTVSWNASLSLLSIKNIPFFTFLNILALSYF